MNNNSSGVTIMTVYSYIYYKKGGLQSIEDQIEHYFGNTLFWFALPRLLQKTSRSGFNIYVLYLDKEPCQDLSNRIFTPTPLSLLL